MIRHHLSPSPIEQVNPTDPSKEGGGAYKPKGFWYEVDGDWRRWCESEYESWLKGRHFIYRVELGDERMLNIRSAEQFDAFHRENVRQLRPYPFEAQPDWSEVALKYDGIEIAPYLWQRRLEPHTMWYYGWDCASGVIWRPRGVRLVLELGSSSTTAKP